MLANRTTSALYSVLAKYHIRALFYMLFILVKQLEKAFLDLFARGIMDPGGVDSMFIDEVLNRRGHISPK